MPSSITWSFFLFLFSVSFKTNFVQRQKKYQFSIIHSIRRDYIFLLYVAAHVALVYLSKVINFYWCSLCLEYRHNTEHADIMVERKDGFHHHICFYSIYYYFHGWKKSVILKWHSNFKFDFQNSYELWHRAKH